MRGIAALAGLLAVVLPASGAAVPSKSEGPLSLAVAHGSVWVGTGSGTLFRVDPGTRRVRAVIRPPATQPGYVRAVTGGFGAVWAADYWGVKRIDPRTNRVRTVEGVAWAPSELAAAAGALWVADFRRNVLFRVHPRRLTVEARIRPEGRLIGLAGGRAGVWVVVVPDSGPIRPGSPREVRRIDVRANRVGRVDWRSDCDVALAVGADALWVSELCTKRVVRIDGATGEHGPPVPVGEAAIAVAVGEGAVWVAGQSDRGVSRIDTATLRVVARISARALRIAVGARVVWLLDPGDWRTGYLRQVDPRTNRLVGRPILLRGS